MMFAILLMFSLSITALAIDSHSIGINVSEIMNNGSAPTIGFSNVYLSYYKSPPSTYSLRTDKRHQLNTSTFVEKNTIGIDLSTIEGQKEFFETYNLQKSIKSMMYSTDLYYTFCDQGDWGVGTAIVNPNGSVKQVFVGDQGETFSLNINGNLQEQVLASGMKIPQTEARYVDFPMYAEGILLFDGDHEYYIPKVIRESGLTVGNLYSMEEVIADIQQNSSKILYDEVLGEEHRDEDGRLSPPTGGSNGNVSGNASMQSNLILFVFGGLFLCSLIWVTALIKKNRKLLSFQK